MPRADAQQRPPQPPPDRPRSTPAEPPPLTPAPAPPKPVSAEEQYDTSDGRTSVRLFYWYNPTHPAMFTGKGADDNVDSTVKFNGKTKPSPGGELSFPAGKFNTIRLSYFRTQGAGNTTSVTPPFGKGEVIWGANLNAGDLLSTAFTLQNAKISLDYTSWPFPVNNARFRLKTLWEVQYTSIRSSVEAPFAPTTDSAGNGIQTSGTGSNWFIWPSLGMGIEYMATKHFRFELKGSGFAIPHRSTIWDTEGFFAYKSGQWELDFGGKAFHFKTSPKRPEYLRATMPGAYVAIRWYLK
jgi:hypothetical protein